jgi:hypothetical protein
MNVLWLYPGTFQIAAQAVKAELLFTGLTRREVRHRGKMRHHALELYMRTTPQDGADLICGRARAQAAHPRIDLQVKANAFVPHSGEIV